MVRRILEPNRTLRNESEVLRFVVGQRSRALGVDARAASSSESVPPRSDGGKRVELPAHAPAFLQLGHGTYYDNCETTIQQQM